MKYVKLVLVIEEDYHESLIAELQEMEFDAFEQQDDRLITYVAKERFNDVHRERIEELLSVFRSAGRGEVYIQSEEVVADQNWNETWEQTIKPQQIGPFFIKPTWSRENPPKGAVMLEIDPKMSFGTGYHETTHLMLNMLANVVREGDEVLDAGTGTGILAIAAIKLGAAGAFCFDLDMWSVTNAQENLLINGVNGKMMVKHGSVETIPDQAEYDVVLANISRNTLLDMLKKLADHLEKRGDLVISGLLKSDESALLRKARSMGLKHLQTLYKNEWIALHLRKT